jgi:hypothetical protein
VVLNSLAYVPAPADAQHLADWVDEHDDDAHWGRYMRGTRRAAAGVSVTIRGWQDASGNVERYVSVESDDAQLDATALRRLAALVLDAADELDGLGNRFA